MAALLLAGVSALLYFPTLGGEFTYDARGQILRDPYIQDPSHLLEVITLKCLSRDILDANRPVHLFALIVDAAIWGKSPVGFHLSDIVLHAVNSALLFMVIVQVLRRTNVDFPVLPAALAGAGLFALHPVNSEAVCGGSYREDLLVNLFVLLALLSTGWLQSDKPGRRRAGIAGCVIALLLAAGSKQSGYIAPLILAAYWLLVGRKEPARPWIVVLVCSTALVTVLALLSTQLAHADSKIVTMAATRPRETLGETALLQLRLWALSVQHVLYPAGLSADYNSASIVHLPTGIAAAVVLLATAAAAWGSLRNRAIAVGAAVIAIGLAPTSNVIPIFRPLADRFLYLPMIGIAVIVAVAFGRLLAAASTRARRLMLITVVVVITGVLTVLTLERQRVWRTRVALWTDTLQKAPGSFTAMNNLGFAYYDRGDRSRAAEVWLGVTRLVPKQHHADGWAGLAIAMEALGRPDRADLAFREAYTRDKRYGDPPKLIEALIWTPGQAAALEPIARRNLPPVTRDP